MTEIKEGYDIPSDLKHTPKHWFGLSNKHALLAALTVVSMYGWYKLTSMMGLPNLVFRTRYVDVSISSMEDSPVLRDQV